MRGGHLSLGPQDIKVDRSSVLGNPYEMERDESNRHRICEADKHWLYANILRWIKCKRDGVPRSQWGTIDPLNLPQSTKNPFDTTGLRIAAKWKAPTVAQVEYEFTRLCYLATQHDINLICWCFPKECHADTRRAAIVWYYKEYQAECHNIETNIREFFG